MGSAYRASWSQLSFFYYNVQCRPVRSWEYLDPHIDSQFGDRLFLKVQYYCLL